MPPRLPEEKRQAIVDAIRTNQGRSRNDIARDFNVAASTIGKIAQESAITDAFDRTHTQKGTQARAADLAEVRSLTSARFLAEANLMLDRLHEPCEVFAFGGVDNHYASHVMEKPPSAEVRNFMTSAAVAMDKHMRADKHDVELDNGGAAVDQWLRHLLGRD